MKHRIATWATLGFLVACCWVLYTFLAPPALLQTSLKDPLVQAFAYVSCPVIYAGRHVPMHFWWIPLINAATYATIGLLLEILRHQSSPGLVS